MKRLRKGVVYMPKKKKRVVILPGAGVPCRVVPTGKKITYQFAGIPGVSVGEVLREGGKNITARFRNVPDKRGLPAIVSVPKTACQLMYGATWDGEVVVDLLNMDFAVLERRAFETFDPEGKPVHPYWIPTEVI